jgi:glutamate-5-semialdehyde dehydrogenase
MSEQFQTGDRIINGEKIFELTNDEARALNEGGRLIALADRLVVVDAKVLERCARGVERARTAFGRMALITDDQITTFFERFAWYLEDDASFAPVLQANALDVTDARSRGRGVGRLEISIKMRQDMIDSARLWSKSMVRKESVVERVEHQGWDVEKVASPLGVVAFVFEGRPNVCVDATGVLRTGNTCVYRIGSDAIGTARAIMERCITPALGDAGLPEGAVVLLDETDRSSGFALFSDSRVNLAVARGSGQAVADLGYVAQSSGVASSLHGTGGAWMILCESSSLERFNDTLQHSLDRKVCNTLNVCCVPRATAMPVVAKICELLDALCEHHATRTTLHMVGFDEQTISSIRCRNVDVVGGSETELGTEFEWDLVPEMFVVATESLSESIRLCNTHSPQFVVSVLTEDAAELDLAWSSINAPFFGDGFTRWVDGQYALGRPELGLSNWQHGRSLARGGILSGDDIRTFRYRMRQGDPSLRR